jgi:hypothetical protein
MIVPAFLGTFPAGFGTLLAVLHMSMFLAFIAAHGADFFAYGYKLLCNFRVSLYEPCSFIAYVGTVHIELYAL